MYRGTLSSTERDANIHLEAKRRPSVPSERSVESLSHTAFSSTSANRRSSLYDIDSCVSQGSVSAGGSPRRDCAPLHADVATSPGLGSSDASQHMELTFLASHTGDGLDLIQEQ